MRCSLCGHDGSPGATFCLNCGSKLAQGASGVTLLNPPGLPARPASCPTCAAENPPGQSYCLGCGRPLSATPVPRGRLAENDVPSVAAGMCVQCGVQNDPHHRFCQQCGCRLPGSASEQSPPVVIIDEGSLSANTPSQGSRVPETSDPANRSATPVSIAHESTAPAPSGRTVLGQPAPAVENRPWGRLVTVRRDGNDGAVHALTETSTILGSKGDLKFIDEHMAARHLRIDRGPQGALVLPLDEVNGVYLRVRAPVPLRDDDLIFVGRQLLRFHRVSETESEVRALVQQGVVALGSPANPCWGRLCQVTASGAHRDIRYLCRGEVVLGREEGDILFPDDEFMSRRHVLLRGDSRGAMVEDLESSNGTFLRLREATEIHTGDHVRVGDHMFRFQWALE